MEKIKNKIKNKPLDKKLLFCLCLIALPVLQFIICYIYVNFNSFVLAFTKYGKLNNSTTFVGFENFQNVWAEMFSIEKVAFGVRLRNSLVTYAFSLLVGMFFAIMFSYYIYKKRLFSGVFKIFLFLPHIIPSVVLISTYKYFVESGLVQICQKLGFEVTSFLTDVDLQFGTVLFFHLFMGFGTQVLMYLGAMNNINPSVTEAAQIDGITFFKELWLITLPCIFGTVSTFVVVGLTGIFTNDLGVYSFYANNADGNIQTLGYFLYRTTRVSATNRAAWPRIATFGLYFTIVVAPISIGVRKIMDKIDPMA